MSIVIITGSAGLVGSESVNYFCDKGFDVIGIDNNLREFFFGKDGSAVNLINLNDPLEYLLIENFRFLIPQSSLYPIVTLLSLKNPSKEVERFFT